MNNDKYVAMDVHMASVSIGVRNASGKLISRAVVETKAQSLKDFIRGLSGTIHLTFEEGNQASWLYDLLSPFVSECIVCNPRRNKLLEDGNKSDELDAEKLSELLYLGRLRAVYHGNHGTRALKELAHNYEALVKDSTRNKNRLKAIFRGRGISYQEGEIYNYEKRAEWLAKLPQRGVRERASQVYEQLAQLEEWVSKAKQLLRSSPLRLDSSVVPFISGAHCVTWPNCHGYERFPHNHSLSFPNSHAHSTTRVDRLHISAADYSVCGSHS